MRYLLCLLLLLGMPVWAASVWKWRDAQGVVHYSDQPVPGAEQVTMATGNTFTTPAATPSAVTTSPAKAPVISYSNVEIWKPNNEATIANSAGVVEVAARVEPQLAPGHRLALYLDGQLVSGYPPQGLSYTLTEIERGAHSLNLVVLDAQGGRVTSSAPVTFYVQQPSVLLRR